VPERAYRRVERVDREVDVELPLDVTEVTEEHGRHVRLVEGYRDLLVDPHGEGLHAAQQALPIGRRVASVVDQYDEIKQLRASGRLSV